MLQLNFSLQAFSNHYPSSISRNIPAKHRRHRTVDLVSSNQIRRMVRRRSATIETIRSPSIFLQPQRQWRRKLRSRSFQSFRPPCSACGNLASRRRFHNTEGRSCFQNSRPDRGQLRPHQICV